jgi:hypothetical protein
MFKPPRNIKYDLISKEDLEEAMAGDERLIAIINRRMEAEAKVASKADAVKEWKAVHKKSFWSLWRAESQLKKEKMKFGELSVKLKTQWQERCWGLFKKLKLGAVCAKRKKNSNTQ